MTQVLIYVTTGSPEEAAAIGRDLVESRLAACANLLPGMTSIYWWDGAVHDDSEASLILKTRADLIEAVTARVKELHSYDCPCVIALPITGGNSDFLNWIVKETR